MLDAQMVGCVSRKSIHYRLLGVFLDMFDFPHFPNIWNELVDGVIFFMGVETSN